MQPSEDIAFILIQGFSFVNISLQNVVAYSISIIHCPLLFFIIIVLFTLDGQLIPIDKFFVRFLNCLSNVHLNNVDA